MQKKILILSSFILLLSGCQSFSGANTVQQEIEIPTVESKYDAATLQAFDSTRKQGNSNRYEGLTINSGNILSKPSNLPPSLFYDSGVNIPYPEDGVKGIYLPVASLEDSDKLATNLNKLDSTALNSVVLDFKDDYGSIVPSITSDNAYVAENVQNAYDYRSLIKTLEKHNIYPIARIVTFKDVQLASKHPDLSFKTQDGELWSPDGSYYLNPFLKEVWDYNVAIAIEAAKMGFKDIQFDYVRFSDAFFSEESSLNYSKGDFENYVSEDPNDAGEERVAAITQFLAYAREKLAPYGVNVSADVFGYTAISLNDIGVRGIGQYFPSISENVDVISSMIYPDHWGPGFFGIPIPFEEPYKIINEYIISEKAVLSDVTNPVKSRPWIQNYTYGSEGIQAQINALADNQIYEYLLWNAFGTYDEEVNYAPEKE